MPLRANWSFIVLDHNTTATTTTTTTTTTIIMLSIIIDGLHVHKVNHGGIRWNLSQFRGVVCRNTGGAVMDESRSENAEAAVSALPCAVTLDGKAGVFVMLTAAGLT